MELPILSDDGRGVMLLLALLTSPLKSKSRLEAENAALRHQLAVSATKARRYRDLAKAYRTLRTPKARTYELAAEVYERLARQDERTKRISTIDKRRPS